MKGYKIRIAKGCEVCYYGDKDIREHKACAACAIGVKKKHGFVRKSSFKKISATKMKVLGIFKDDTGYYYEADAFEISTSPLTTKKNKRFQKLEL